MKGSDTMNFSNFSKNSKNFWLLIAVFFAFAAISVGGCGSSSNSSSRVSDSTLDLPTMFDIRTSEKFTQMIDRLKSEGIWSKVMEHKVYNFNEYLTPEELEEVLKEIPEEERDDLIWQNKFFYDEIVSNYNNGWVLIVFHPSEEAIKHTAEVLKGLSVDVTMLNITPDTEIFAYTKQAVNGYEVSEVEGNTLQLDQVFAYVVPDISTLVSIDEYNSIYEVEEKYIDFQVERWERYYRWLAGIKDKAKENISNASAIRASAAADNDIVERSKVFTGTYDWSYSNLKEWSKWEIVGGYDKDILESFSGNRINILDYQIYSVHSFTDKYDYFVISSNMYTNPTKVVSETRIDYYGNRKFFLEGFTLGNEINISLNRGDSEIGEVVKTSLTQSIYRENFMWSADGIFAAHSFGAFDGISFTKTLIANTDAVKFINTSTASSANVRSEFFGPAQAKSPIVFIPRQSSIEEHTYPFIAVLRVGQDDWKKGYDDINLNLQGEIRDGVLLGYVGGNARGTFEKYFAVNVTSPNQPMHSTVHQRNYAFPREGDLKDASVRIHSEGDWELVHESSESEWVQIGDYSGKATPPEGEWVHFDIPENTTGRARFAKIMLIARPYEDKTKIESTVIDLYQAAD